jgi:hypothetical protein
LNKKSLCNKIRLIACPVRYYIIKYPLQVDLVENSFSSVGRVVAFGAEYCMGSILAWDVAINSK